MRPTGRPPDWRDRAAASLLLRHVEFATPPKPMLIMGDPRPDVETSLDGKGIAVAVWNRRAFGNRRATSWPPEGPFGSVALRLPRAKEELDMMLHGAAGSLAPGGVVLVYGAKDEGIGSVPRRLEPLFQEVETVEVGGHCRIIRGRLRQGPTTGQSGLHEWRQVIKLEHGPLGRDWISYPGVFAHGRLDAGTRLLLDSVPDLPQEARVLDYGCGSGVVAAMVRILYPQVRLELLDVDAVSLVAARENVPDARVLLRDGLPVPDEEGFHAILSNPPFHRGKTEEPEMVLDLIRGAPALLQPRGGLVLVAQRRLPLEGAFQGAFRKSSVRMEDGAFKVWEGWFPR